MHTPRIVLAVWVLLLALLVPMGPAAAQTQIIVIRTGQHNASPGTCPQTDTNFNCIASANCALPLSPRGFTATDFANACNGSPAVVVTPNGAWLQSLPGDPLARWINSSVDGLCESNPASVLYCAAFTESLECPIADSIHICWAVDDLLGDPVPGPNPDGAYINGQSLGPAFRGLGCRTLHCATATIASGLNIKLNTGVNANRLQIYQRDTRCVASGLLLSCTIYVHSRGAIGTIVGTKYDDVNCNGMQDPLETPIPYWPINLRGVTGSGGAVSLTTQTDLFGRYSFTNLPPGSYTISEVTKADYVECGPTCGTGGQYVFSVSPDSCRADTANFGNSRCDTTDFCWDHAASLSAWYPFDEGSGSTAQDVAANHNLTFANNPAWTPDMCTGWAADLSWTPQFYGPYLTGGSYPENNFGTHGFSIFAWVKMSTNALDGRSHILVDKRDPPGTISVPSKTAGYVVYLLNDAAGNLRVYVRIQKPGNNPNNPSQYAQYEGPSGLPGAILPGAWTLVGVTACRNPLNPASNTLTVYVNGNSRQYTSTTVPPVDPENLNNSASLTVGNQCTGWPQWDPFRGAIDGLQLFSSCLTPAQVGVVLDHPCTLCNWEVYVPSVAADNGSLPCTGPAISTFQICNHSLSKTCTYKWTIAGLSPLSCGGTIAGPTFFTPYSGCVTLAPGKAAKVQVKIEYPAGFLCNHDVACYQVTVKNMCTGFCKSGQGQIVRGHFTFVPTAGSLVPVTDTTAVPVVFEVRNPTGAPARLSYRLTGRSSDGDESNQVVSLNGLPPGTPVTGTLVVAPGDSGRIQVQATLTGMQPLNINEVVLSVDWDGSGVYMPASVEGLQTGSLDGFTSMDESLSEPALPAAQPMVSSAMNLRASPNPFAGDTQVQFRIAGPGGTVRVGVFDVTGRAIRELHSGPLEAGEHTFAWDGLDKDGRRTKEGIYFIRVESAGTSTMTKVVRVK